MTILEPQPGRGAGLGEVDEDALYAAVDWLLERQEAMSSAWPIVI